MHRDNRRFLELISCYLDAALTGEQEAELLAFLEDPRCQDRFLALVAMHSEIEVLLSAPVADDLMAAAVLQDVVEEPAEPLAGALLPPLLPPPAARVLLPEAPPTFSSVMRPYGAWWPAGIAAALLIGTVLGTMLGGAYWAQRTVSPPIVDDSEGAVGPGDVAVLTRAVNVVWDMPAPPPVGSGLVPGRLKLRSGWLQLEFYSGATVILEGPADFELLATDHGFCHRGKLRAKLSPQSRGFTIGTATVDLVDLGTEFGMQVDANGGGEVQVFDGKVELHRKEPGQADVRQEVSGGQGVQIDPAGTLRPTVARPEAFVGVAELEQRSLTAAQDRYRAWQEASRGLKTDPRVVLHYDFEGQQHWDRVLRNQGPGGPENLDGGIVGCPWVTGRWPGKRALEFKRPSDRVRLDVPGKFKALSVLAWVRVDGLDNRFNALLLADAYEESRFHWQLLGQGRLNCTVAAPPGAYPHLLSHSSASIVGADRFGQWIHLATVCDPWTNTSTHYVNGSPVSSAPLPVAFAHATIGPAALGNWDVPRTGAIYPTRNFNGRIDEFTLFREALSAAEIGEMFKTGKPN